MALRHRLSPRLSSTLALLGAALLAPAGERAWATSKAKVAAIGDAAPGGGVFAGPGFIGWPTAAGNGWIAFRGQVSGGTSSETIVAAHLTPPVSRAQVASIGQTAPSGNGYEACAGKLKQFVGHPVVNASGEVAFIALLTPPPDKSRSSGTTRGPTPAGLFALRGGQLVAVACSGEEVGGRTLDLTAVLDLASDPSSDLADRSPAMNDAGDVAFLAGYVDALGFPNGGAILLAPRAGGMTRLVRIDDPFASGRLQALGPPVLNNRGMLAFHALSTTTDPSDHGMLDGVFAVDATGANLRVLVRDGIAPSPAGQPLTEFQDAVALDDDGDVAFLAGPLSDDADPSDEGSPGVLVLRGGAVSLLAYPGQVLGAGKVTGVALGPAGGGALAAPSIGPDGTVAFFASLDGNAEVIARTAGRGALPLVYTGGNGADASPVGGLYGGAESPPALDAAGGIVFLARIVNGQSSEAIVYRAADGRTSPIALGEAVPQQSQGFFAGRPFSAPHMNDAGDIVFRAYVARGPASSGIFRARSALIDPEHGMPIETVVRAGDASPAPGAPPFFDFPGEPSVNRAGAVAFAARLPSVGHGLFVADARGVRPIVLRGDPAPGDPGTTFTGLGTHPQLNDSGGVAFRATTSFRDPSTGSSIKREGIFLAESSRIRALVYAHEPSPAGPPFLSLGDPLLSNAPGVVFRAPLGDLEEESSGIFTADPTGTAAVAVAQQPLGGGVVLSSFSGSPSVTPNGGIAFLATLSVPIGPDNPALASLGPAILTETPAGPVRVAARGTAGPAGGLFNNLGPPALNSQAHVVFSGSFAPQTGGVPGLFLAANGGLSPYLLRGEMSPGGGRLAAFGRAPSLNASDELACSATVIGGTAQSAILVASPTVLAPRAVVLHLTGGRGRDRIRLALALALGRVSNGVRPAKEPVILSLSDRNGVLWTVTVPKKQLARHGRSFAIVPSPGSSLGHHLRSLKLRLSRDGTVRVVASSAPVDLLRGGERTLEPPFTLSLEVGDDAGTVAVPCRLGPSGGRCL